MSPALAGEFFTISATWEAPYMPIIPQIKKEKKRKNGYFMKHGGGRKRLNQEPK